MANEAAETPNSTPTDKSKIMKMAAAVAVVLLLLIGGYLIYRNYNNGSTPSNENKGGQGGNKLGPRPPVAETSKNE